MAPFDPLTIYQPLGLPNNWPLGVDIDHFENHCTRPRRWESRAVCYILAILEHQIINTIVCINYVYLFVFFSDYVETTSTMGSQIDTHAKIYNLQWTSQISITVQKKFSNSHSFPSVNTNVLKKFILFQHVFWRCACIHAATSTLWEPAYDIFVLRFWLKKQQFSVALPTP